MTCGSLIHSYNFIGKTIDDGRLRFVELLGEGAYGVVYRAIDESSAPSSASSAPQSYAVKVMEKAHPGSRRWRYQQREVATHLCVEDHPNVVSIHGLYECANFIYIVLEYCTGGDLLGAMMDRLLYCRNDALLKKVFVQLLDAVEYCHHHGIYHRDLKPDNILVNEDGTHLKVADFGLATTAKVSDTFGCGSSYYMSPECIGEDYHFHPYSTEASDVWSLGVILTNLVAGRNPWNYATPKDKCYRNYLKDPGYLRRMLPISHETFSILQTVFDTDPVARITIPELRQRIVTVKSFYMSDEDIAKGNEYVKMAAASYRPLMSEDEAMRLQSILCDDDARELLGQASVRIPASLRAMKSKTSTTSIATEEESNESNYCGEIKPKFVIVPFEGISGSSWDSSSEESREPITPETHAQDHVKLVEVPEFLESEKIGEAIVPVVRKGLSLPLRMTRPPVPITVRA